MEDAFAQLCTVSTGVGPPAAKFPSSEARTLRRRRSAASAALLSRPSMLPLGELVPSFETCVLVYISSPRTTTDDCGKQTPRLVYALFEPNFLVDGASRHVRKLDRASWEHLRAHVEELRIVALSSQRDVPVSEPSSPVTSTTIATAAVRKPDCVFDLSMQTDEAAQLTTSLYLQPHSYASVPAKSKEQLLEIEIHAPYDESLAKQRTVCLPAQVRAVLCDAEELMDQTTPPLSPLLTPPIVAQPGETRFNDAAFAATCDRILRLVESTVSLAS
ncbi:hypothetical protein EX895_004946 [Sporisorium graminicola]|uniref:Uncharacterized protein n=1 Tax=Sporisorium graminicola TaxID=280036 RepID=A0A4U7KP39_9BASI|nr:hypothetical protein EX895_004946 [Sporisorium graminicola]TKY86121.1 hypothetical protein EX895_004946 [Sporisorium graminicola]